MRMAEFQKFRRVSSLYDSEGTYSRRLDDSEMEFISRTIVKNNQQLV